MTVSYARCVQFEPIDVGGCKPDVVRKLDVVVVTICFGGSWGGPVVQKQPGTSPSGVGGPSELPSSGYGHRLAGRGKFCRRDGRVGVPDTGDGAGTGTG